MSNLYGLGLSIGFAAGVGTGLSIGRSEGNKIKKNMKQMLADGVITVKDSSGNELSAEQFLELLKKNKQ